MSKKILIVDDEPFIRILLQHTLEKLTIPDVAIILADGGKEGLALALEEKPDLLFLDIMMPVLNGYEVCQKVKAVYPNTHVIFLTSKGQEIDKRRASDAGGNEYITKPFDPDLIIQRATHILALNNKS